MTADVLVLGAGASGLMAALTASAQGKKVILVEGGPVAGRKVRIAGGGRGNYTNRHMSPDHFSGVDAAFTRHVLRKFPPQAMLALLDECGIPWEEREYGQIFGLQPAVRLVDALVQRCREQGVEMLFRQQILEAVQVQDVMQDQIQRFVVRVADTEFSAKALILALGSPAWPDSGATDGGLRLAKGFGHSCEPFRPALTPLLLESGWLLAGLQGISADVALHCGGRIFRQPLLITHRGLSGPAALQASGHWRAGSEILLDFWPDGAIKDLLHAPENGSHPALTLLRKHLPVRLAETLLAEAERRCLAATLPVPSRERGVAQWSRKQREMLANVVHRLGITPVRSEGMTKAEAAGGGVRTVDFDPRTLESRKVSGLYVVGELLDITGDLGGYNLHWAFASGYTAGLN